MNGLTWFWTSDYALPVVLVLFFGIAIGLWHVAFDPAPPKGDDAMRTADAAQVERDVATALRQAERMPSEAEMADIEHKARAFVHALNSGPTACERNEPLEVHNRRAGDPGATWPRQAEPHHSHRRRAGDRIFRWNP